MQVLRLINCHDAPHILLVDQVHDLATVGDHFQRLTSHDNVALFEHFPVLEPRHNPRENLIKVLVHRRVLITELLCLVQQILA